MWANEIASLDFFANLTIMTKLHFVDFRDVEFNRDALMLFYQSWYKKKWIEFVAICQHRDEWLINQDKSTWQVETKKKDLQTQSIWIYSCEKWKRQRVERFYDHMKHDDLFCVCILCYLNVTLWLNDALIEYFELWRFAKITTF